MHKGSCLCGAVSYTLATAPKAVTNCHCKMCQKQHGAAFATYASLPVKDVTYLTGETILASYQSSEGIVRRFCNVCGSSIEWRGSKQYPDWTSIAIATLDTPFVPENIKNIHLDSKACWLDMADSR